TGASTPKYSGIARLPPEIRTSLRLSRKKSTVPDTKPLRTLKSNPKLILVTFSHLTFGFPNTFSLYHTYGLSSGLSPCTPSRVCPPYDHCVKYSHLPHTLSSPISP